METGKVKCFNATKGYGFIVPASGAKDIFVHSSAVTSAGLSTLKDGQAVSYEIENNRGRDSAVDIKVI